MHINLKTKWIILLSLLFIATSCIDEDLSDCPSGLSVGFTYNLYNQDMEHANAFENVVSDMTLMVFDAEGTLVSQHIATSDDLKHNGYRIDVCCLPSGNYQLLVWGGIVNGSFVSDNLVEGSSKLDDVLVSLNTMQQGVSDTDLVPLFYGMGTLDNYKNTKFTRVEIPLVKNTNRFRILLQNVGNEDINPDAFSFEIIDKNTALNYKNELANDVEVVYSSYAQGNASIQNDKGEAEVVKWVVFAELNTSKLFDNHSKTARLRIYNNETEKEVLNVPLIELVLMMKNEKFSKSITNQTYLDRIHNFNLTFFLSGGDVWMKTHIIINDWVVRFNDIDDL